MPLKLPFKWSWSGEQAHGQSSIDSRTVLPTHLSGPATIDPNVTIIGRAAAKASRLRIPLIGHMSIVRQIRYLLIFLSICMVVLAIFAVLTARNAARTTTNVELLGDSLMHSQRLARSAPLAFLGKSVAFRQMKDSFDRLDANFIKLSETTSGDTAQELLKQSRDKWEISRRAAEAILKEEAKLTSLGAALRKINEDNPAVLDLSEQIAALKLKNNSSSREIFAANQLTMLSQRIARNANQLLSGDTVNPDVAFLLGKDTNTFQSMVEGLVNGSEVQRLQAANDAETKALLTELLKSFTNYRESIDEILSARERIEGAKQAEKRIFNESEGMKEVLTNLGNEYLSQQTWRWLYWACMVAAGLLALMSAVLIGKLFLDDSSRRAREAERQRELAERQEAEVKRLNSQNQAAILRLMNELQEVADGDLTIKATVSEDITGAIADSVNYTVEELRSLVGRINRTAEQVSGASGQAAARSQELSLASAQQSREIRQTGESVLRMAQKINDVSASALESANVARQSLKAAEEGQRAVQNAISGMNDIRTQIQETSKRIKRLGESSQEIGEIIELITDITEQTNVLALNAAIQAASAGEAGRGFSVVAEEVQRLAERSQEATKQIGALIRTIQTDTQDAVAAMEQSTQGVVEGAKLSDEAGRALAGIGIVSRELAELIERISTSTSQQAASAGDVARNIQRILAVTEQTSAGTELTAKSIRELSDLATELKSSVSRFRVA
jgi:twitching motility protein PilJ